jgi:probable selenium-dependent hydroxylase accessory protein YqeC
MQHIQIEEAFPFLREKGHVISLVGGGGKTTLLYELSARSAAFGWRTLVTTTTHMYRPSEEMRAYSTDEVRQLWQKGRPAVIGADAAEGKIRMPDEALLGECCSLADVVWIEADGAKRMPCKVPKAGEPVLLSACDIVIGVAGMNAVGQPLSSACFRQQEAMELLGVSEDHLLTEENLAVILSSERGTKKGTAQRTYYIVLNQCDTQEKREQAEKIAQLLAHLGETRVLMSCCKDRIASQS